MQIEEELYVFDEVSTFFYSICCVAYYIIGDCFSVWEYTFAPREYLHQHLETRFARALAGMVMYSPETGEIAKPSELLTSVKAYMNVLQTVENYINIDITRVFNNVLLQQTQQVRQILFIKKNNVIFS